MGEKKKMKIIKTLRNNIKAAGSIGSGKHWTHIPLTKAGKPIRQNMHVKKGDTVVVIAGDYKSKVGEVKSVYSKMGRISIKGVRIVTKHIKPTNEGEKGKISRFEGVIHQSNVMHWSIDKQVKSRTGHKLIKGKKFRYLKATGEILGGDS